MKVLFFARARDLAGVDSVSLEMPAGATVGDLRGRLGERFPRLAGLLAHCAIAVDDDFVGDDTALSSAAEVAILPPVSGGAR